MRNNTAHSTALLAAISLIAQLVFFLPVHAQGAAAEPAPATVGELNRIQAATIIAKAQANLAKIQATLPTNVAVAADPNAKGLPAVQLVDGNGARLEATLIYPSGAIYIAKTGDEAPGGYHVDAVRTTAVVLSKQGQTFKLGFSNRAEAVSSESPAQRSIGMLPFPPQSIGSQ